jgi:hypothetical protein
MLEVTLEQATRFTLKSHFLTERTENGVLRVISRIAGLNSQTARAPYISLWSRIKGFKKDQIDKSLYGGARHAVPLLIKTWLMRGTVHTIPSDEYPLFQKALGPELAGDWKATLQRHGLGLSIKAREKLGRKIVDLLTGASLTKNELLPQIKHLVQGFSDREQKIILSRTLRGLSYEGLICHAEPTGPWYHFKQNRFTAVENWFKDVRFDKVDEARARKALALKYLTGYGPVSVADFAYWTGLKTGEAKEAFEGIKDRLVEVRIRDVKGTYWVPVEQADTLTSTEESTGSPVRFLPEFDPLIMGHKDKSRILDEVYRKHVFLRLADVAPVFLLNGRVAGTWNYKFTDHSFNLTPFAKLGKKEEESIDEEFTGLREFLRTE